MERDKRDNPIKKYRFKKDKSFILSDGYVDCISLGRK